MPLARSFTQKLSKLSRKSSSTPPTPLESPSTPTNNSNSKNGGDYFYSICFEDTKQTEPKPALGEAFSYNPNAHHYSYNYNQYQQHSQSTTTLSRASSLLSRRSSRRRVPSGSEAGLPTPTSMTFSSGPSTPAGGPPLMGYSPSPSLSRVSYAGSLMSDAESDELFSASSMPYSTPLSNPTTNTSASAKHRTMPSTGSSLYSAQHSLGSVPGVPKGNSTSGCVSVSEEEEVDMVAMLILEKVSARDYMNDIETCFA